MNKLIELIKSPLKIFVFLANRNINFFNDETYLKIRYRATFHKKLDFENPKTFNEKLQWLKINNRKDIYTTLVDKYEVKEYISNKIGQEYVIPTIGIYNTFDEIDFEKLPNQFVIKCTHDSGGLVIVKNKDKFNKNIARRKIEKSLKRNYYYPGREWPYKNVKPRIIIEKYMEDSETTELRDYKFFCFNGKVKYFKIDFDRATYHRANYYDTNGNIQNFGEIVCPPDYDKKLKMPKNLKKMIELAEILSEKYPFIRVDFYEMNNKVYFGELTFYPASGFGKFTSDEWDYKLGNLIKLEMVEKDEK